MSPERILKNGIGHVPEGRRLFRGLSVRDNMMLGAYTRRDKAKIKSDIEDMERLFPILGQRRRPARRDTLGRRTADAGHCQGAHGQAQGAAPG